MLTEVCDYVHNYFEREVYEGTFTISNGTINLGTRAVNGQRFRIIGSALNDGIYTYYTDGQIYDDDNTEVVTLSAETFTGKIAVMGVPIAFLRIVYAISEWLEKNQTALDSPYTSESFGGYSYTKATGVGANAGGVLGWQDVFRSKLNAYRKIA